MDKKGLKIAGITLGAVMIVVLVIWLFGSMFLTNVVDSFLHKELGQLSGVYVDYKNLHVGQSSITADDVVFCTSPDNVLQDDSTGTSVHIDRIAVRGCNFIHMLNRNQLDIRSITLTRPVVVMHTPVERHEAPIPESVQDSDSTAQASVMKNIVVRTIKIEDGSFRMKDVSNRMALQLEGLCVRAHGLGYHFGDDNDVPEGESAEGHILYNDSLYELSLKNFSIVSPDGLMCVEVGELSTKDAGPLLVQGIHAYNTCKKGELAEKKGKIQVDWIDVSLAELTTTPVNLLRQAVERNFHIDTVRVKGDVLHMMKDARYPAPKPYPMPQDELLKMDFPIEVACVLMTAPTMNVEVVTTHLQNCGALEMRDVDIRATNVTNRNGETTKALIHSALGHGGDAKIRLNMKMDKAAHFDFQADMTGLQGSTFNQFLHPLFGAEIACNIHSINTAYAGDRDSVAGTFCMQYDSMRVEVFKEDAPYAAIARNAGAINFFAPMIVPKSNPKPGKAEPITYNVHATRDPQHNFPVYLIAPMMDGLMQTLLPGFVVKMIAKKQDKKQQK